MTAMAADLDRITAERIRDEFTKLLCGADPVTGLRLLVDTGLADRFLPELPGLKLEIDEHAQHKDVYEHTLTVVSNAVRLEGAEGPDFVLRMAALMHDVGKPATKAVGADGRVSFHHHEVVGARLTKPRMKALQVPQGRDLRRGRAGRAAPALLRVRPGRVDRLGGAPVRHRRRRPAAPAAQADPLGLHHPQPAQGGPAGRRLRRAGGADRPDRGRGGPGPGPARTSTATRSWSCSACRRARSSAGPGGTSRSCGWSAARCDRDEAEAELLRWARDEGIGSAER